MGSPLVCAVIDCREEPYGQIVLKEVKSGLIPVCFKHYKEFMEVYKLIYQDPAVQ